MHLFCYVFLILVGLGFAGFFGGGGNVEGSDSICLDLPFCFRFSFVDMLLVLHFIHALTLRYVLKFSLLLG